MPAIEDNVTVSVENLEDGVIHAKAKGQLSWDSHAKLGEQLDIETDFDWRSRPLLLDLIGVGFIDSSGISSLLTLHREVAQHGGKLVVCNVPPRIDQTFRLVGLSRMITVAGTLQEARPLLTA